MLARFDAPTSWEWIKNQPYVYRMRLRKLPLILRELLVKRHLLLLFRQEGGCLHVLLLWSLQCRIRELGSVLRPTITV